MKMLGTMLPLALILVVASLLAAPPAVAAGPPVVSNIWLPIEGTAFYPPNPCFNNGEVGDEVSLAGMVHVLAMVPLQPQPNPYAMIFINLADVKGTGEPSGMMYLATGAFKTGAPLDPTCNTCISVNVSGRVDLVQAGACPTIRGGARVTGTLLFNEDGTLNEGSSLVIVPPNF